VPFDILQRVGTIQAMAKFEALGLLLTAQFIYFLRSVTMPLLGILH
jgi:hypothetical protein